MTTNAIDSEGTDRSHHHTAIVLFYKYFDPSKYPLVAGQHASFYEERIRDFQQDLCSRLSLKGRVAVAREGINGTLSAPSASLLKSYVEAMEAFELIRDVGIPNEDEEEDDEATGLSCQPHFLFSDIDWKESSVQNAEQGILEPFPDLKIAIVKEIISSGSTVTARDVAAEGGRHLTAKEFHDAMLNNPDAVLIDVRNSFEHSIGHFVHPLSGVPAVNPDTKEFSTFDSTYCKREADNLKDKMVLLSCTGGIRCEKACVMLRRRGVKDVYQLKGGIHRYLEEFGGDPGSAFHGLNFVFDQRVAMEPSVCKRTGARHNSASQNPSQPTSTGEGTRREIVGACFECGGPFDEYCGSRICTVCRDLVLACPKCQEKLLEYHCIRHRNWRNCYFTFLGRFDVQELSKHRQGLEALLGDNTSTSKKVRKTLTRQIQKIETRIADLEAGRAVVDGDSLRHCRSCFEPAMVCDGRCWGFWKTASGSASTAWPVDNEAVTGTS